MQGRDLPPYNREEAISLAEGLAAEAAGRRDFTKWEVYLVVARTLEDLPNVAGQNALRYWEWRRRAAKNANYRVGWSDAGYVAQYRMDTGWMTVGYPARPSECEARLDCKLDAKLAGVRCDISPCLANLTEGRPEYEHDPEGPYPF